VDYVDLEKTTDGNIDPTGKDTVEGVFPMKKGSRKLGDGATRRSEETGPGRVNSRRLEVRLIWRGHEGGPHAGGVLAKCLSHYSSWVRGAVVRRGELSFKWCRGAIRGQRKHERKECTLIEGKEKKN